MENGDFVVFCFVWCKKELKISFATISGIQITLFGEANLLIISLNILQ